MSKAATKALIDANITANGTQAITGPILNNVLNTMVDDYGTQEELSQLAQEVGDFSDWDEQGYQPLAVTPKTGYYFYFTTLDEVEAATYQYVTLSVTPGEKYKISGYNGNSNIPLATARKSGTNTKVRAISQSGAGAMNGEYTVPEGYDTLYINGLTASAPVTVEKWTDSPGSAEKAVREIDAIIGAGNISLSGWEEKNGTKTTGKYIKLDLTEVSNASYEFVELAVNEGEKYYIEGWNINSNIPVCIFAKSGTSTSTRGKYDAFSIGMNGEVTVPTGFDTMYVNGNITQHVPVLIKKQIVGNNLTDVSKILDSRFTDFNDEIAPLYAQLYETDAVVGDHQGAVINIAKRWDENNDLVWIFENKAPTANNFFDLRGVGIIPRGTKKVQDFICVTNTTRIVESMSDFILPICVGAVSDKDGDFPTNTALFTGGAHGYNNSSLSTASATMREISRSVKIDGIELTDGDRKYGNILTIDVVNNIQGCNTEKEDGSGREIIQQHINVVIDREKVRVQVTFTALEDVNIYAIDGLGQALAFSGVRFIGSTSKRGLYVAGERAVTEDKHTNIVRCEGDTYFFDVCMDRTFGLAQDGGMADYNAMATVATKGYFHLIGETPLALEEGDSVSFRGGFALGKVPATS